MNKIKKELYKWKNFMVVAIGLAIFFGLEYFHTWANDFIIKLHFCNHYFCIIFAVIFCVIAFMAYNKKKAYVKLMLIVLVVGIILMNMAVCDINGSMSIGSFSLGFASISFDTHTECTPGVDCAGDVVEVPIPPCIETDAGRDYLTFGTILSGANLDDLCMGDILRERYCSDTLTYTSEDIDCTTLGVGWTCEEGECREGEIIVDIIEEEEEIIIGNETDCGDGIDNDGDGLIDCDDLDCQIPLDEGGCGDFDYSCEHTSDYPTCGGTCQVGYECGVYNTGDGTLDAGWCECMPEDETPCYESSGCDGWCDDGYDYICTGDTDGCYCEWVYDLETCYDSDGGIEPTIGGFVFYTPLNMPDVCEFKFDNWLTEYSCGEDRIVTNPIDCAELGLICIDGIGDEGAYCGEGVL